MCRLLTGELANEHPRNREESSALGHTTLNTLILAVAVTALGAGTLGHAQSGTVDTRIGTLEFERGLPTKASVQKLFDALEFQRAVQVYLWALPLVRMAGWQRAHYDMFGAHDGDIVIYNTYRDKLGILTANATTPYLISFVNLTHTGPCACIPTASAPIRRNSAFSRPAASRGGRLSRADWPIGNGWST
jgi:hypothetical protein